MTMDTNIDGNVWVVQDAISSLLELVDSISQNRLPEEREDFRSEMQKVILMLTAAIILADGKYMEGEHALIRQLVELGDTPGGELSYLNEYTSLWATAAREVPKFFRAAIDHDTSEDTDFARSILREIQRLGNHVAISDGKFRTKERGIVMKYVACLEEFIGASNVESSKDGAVDKAEDATGEVPVAYREPSELPDSKHPSRLSPPISREYFDLLLSTSNEVLIMIDTLESDRTLIRSLESLVDTGKINNTDFLRACVMFDLVQIFKIVLGSGFESKLVEMSSVAFAVGHIFGSKDFIESVDYDKFVALHYEGVWITSAKAILNEAATNNPINISLGWGSDAPVMRESDFSLPAFLCYSGSETFEKYAVTLRQFATVIAKADGVISGSEERLLKDVYEKVHNPIPEINKHPVKVVRVSGNQSMGEVLDELDSLVGLESVKQEVKTLINFANIQKERVKQGLKSPHVSYHIVLIGSPGTGKTTVARIVSKIYNKLGILKKGQLVETDRSGLVGEFVGQTSVKVNKTVDSALDGVLFIDEAYSLVDGGKEDYGREALATLLKRMEDERDRLVVMVAGYTEEMKDFINANSGLKSRFSRYIEFPDYTPEEMSEIFERQCRGLDYNLTNEAKVKALDLFQVAYMQRDKSFGNGRYVRNMFEQSMELQANRVAGLSPLTKETLTTITGDDIPAK